jgi:hypothetical protein
MPTSLTRDWEFLTIPLVETLLALVRDYEKNKEHDTEYVDDGQGDVEGVDSEEAYTELYDDMQSFLCDFIEAVEERTLFVADCDLSSIVHDLIEKPAAKWRVKVT